jgi:hypothetical protein
MNYELSKMKRMKGMKKQSAGLNMNNPPPMKRSDWGQGNELHKARQALRRRRTL